MTSSTPPAGRSALARCVGHVERFLAEAWATRPLHHPGGGAAFADLLSMEDVERLVSGTALRTPAFRLVKDGRPLAPASYTRSTRTGSTTVSGVADARRIFEHFRNGATIVLQGLHRFWPPLTGFCRELELALGHPTQVNAYITPPGARGLALHHDSHDVFVLQSFGRKRWEVHEPAAGGGGRRAVRLELTPGDGLYLPVGTPHAASTQDVVSGHLTVGVLSYTWMDLLEEVVKAARADRQFAERLPIAFQRDPETFRSGLKDRLSELQAWLAAFDPDEGLELMLRRFLTSRPSILPGAMRGVLALDALDDDAVVRRRPGSVCELLVRGDRLLAFLGDRELRMPAWVEPGMRAVVESDRFAVRDLGGHLDPESRLVLVRRLVREGLLEVAVDG